MKYGRLVMKGEVHNGTGFVCYWKAEDAAKVLKYAEQGDRKK